MWCVPACPTLPCLPHACLPCFLFLCISVMPSTYPYYCICLDSLGVCYSFAATLFAAKWVAVGGGAARFKHCTRTPLVFPCLLPADHLPLSIVMVAATDVASPPSLVPVVAATTPLLLVLLPGVCSLSSGLRVAYFLWRVPVRLSGSAAAYTFSKPTHAHTHTQPFIRCFAFAVRCLLRVAVSTAATC